MSVVFSFDSVPHDSLARAQAFFRMPKALMKGLENVSVPISKFMSDRADWAP